MSGLQELARVLPLMHDKRGREAVHGLVEGKPAKKKEMGLDPCSRPPGWHPDSPGGLPQFLLRLVYAG